MDRSTSIEHHSLVLTSQAILESDDAVHLVVSELIEIVNSVPEPEQVGLVRGMSRGMRMVWGVFMVDSEVNNGGFNQFFWNSSRHFLQEALDGLALIGADGPLRLLTEAVARFEQQFERLRPYVERGTIDAFSESYDELMFDDLDERYCDFDTHAAQEAYIRDHLDEFASA